MLRFLLIFTTEQWDTAEDSGVVVQQWKHGDVKLLFLLDGGVMFSPVAAPPLRPPDHHFLLLPLFRFHSLEQESWETNSLASICLSTQHTHSHTYTPPYQRTPSDDGTVADTHIHTQSVLPSFVYCKRRTHNVGFLPLTILIFSTKRKEREREGERGCWHTLTVELSREHPIIHWETEHVPIKCQLVLFQLFWRIPWVFKQYCVVLVRNMAPRFKQEVVGVFFNDRRSTAVIQLPGGGWKSPPVWRHSCSRLMSWSSAEWLLSSDFWYSLCRQSIFANTFNQLLFIHLRSLSWHHRVYPKFCQTFFHTPSNQPRGRREEVRRGGGSS